MSAIGTLTATSTTPLGPLREFGTLTVTGPTQLRATFAQAGGGGATQTANLELLAGPYGGQVVRISAWPSLRDTEAGTLLARVQTLTLRLWGDGHAGAALVAFPRCDVRQQTTMVVRPTGLGGSVLALLDDYALTGCAGDATAAPLGGVDALPSALVPFFATQARKRGEKLGWLRTILVPEPAPGTEVVAVLRTPGAKRRRLRASASGFGDISLTLNPRAPITPHSELTLTATMPGGQAVLERFRFTLTDGALRARGQP